MTGQFLAKAVTAVKSLHKAEPLAIPALAFVVFVLSSLSEVIDDTLEGDTHGIDTAILRMLRHTGDVSDPLGPRWVEEMMRDATALGGIAILTFLTVIAFIYLLTIKKKAQAVYLACAVATGTILTNILKAGFDRPRPEFMPEDAIVYTGSFPSGHSMMAAVVYLTLGVLLAETQKRYSLKIYIMSVCIFITLIVGFSRLYLGVHWPSDVLAGWLGGTAWAVLCWGGARAFHLYATGRATRA